MMKKEHRDVEQKMKIKFQTILDQKQSEIARINKDKEVLMAQMKQMKIQNSQLKEYYESS